MATRVKDKITGKRIFYGWRMVTAAALLNFFSGGVFLYGFTTFFNPIRQSFDWSATATSVAFSFQRLESGLAGPIVGFLVDRLGSRKLMLFGWSVFGLGFILMSRINSLWTFYGAFVLIAVGMSFGSFTTIYAAIANWFVKRRSRAMMFSIVGTGVSGTLATPLIWSIGKFGWRETLLIIGITAWVFGLPLCLAIRHKPAPYGYLPDGEKMAPGEARPSFAAHSATEKPRELSSSPASFTAKEALKTRTFWLLSIVILLWQIGMSAVMVHIVPYLESVGVPREVAGIGITGVTVFSLIGRFGFGFLGDFKNKRYLMAIALALQILGLFIFSLVEVDKVWLMIIFLLTYAPGYSGTLTLRPALQADYFGPAHFGTIMGLSAAVAMAGGISSPIIAGWIFDATGSYRLAWQLYALVILPAIPLILLARPPKTRA